MRRRIDDFEDDDEVPVVVKSSKMETGETQQKDTARRKAHTAAEKKRRDAIRQGYDDLASLVPSCQDVDPLSATKLSKAVILSKTIDYIEQISSDAEHDENELRKLQKETTGLKIMLGNYDSIIKSHRANHTYNVSANNSDSAKLQFFQNFTEELFKSFDSEVKCDNFQNLSNGMLHWSERHCKPELLHHIFDVGLNRDMESRTAVGTGNSQMRVIYQHADDVTTFNNYPNEQQAFDPRR